MDGSLGASAYMERLLWRRPWSEIAQEVGYSDHSGARKGAERYARHKGLPWPLRPETLGGKIYSCRRHGVSWLYLSRHYDRPIRSLQVLSYKWARRNDRHWPPHQAL